jgi:protein arginine kinase
MNNEASIVYSKINIKRNIGSYNFVNILSDENKKKLENEVVEYLVSIEKDNQIYDLSSLKEIDRTVFYEEELLTNEFVKKSDGKFVHLLNNNLSILLNDRDHLNIFIVRPDFKLNTSYKIIENIEEKLGKHFNFAASNKYGFLTSNIKNSGIAMKINVIVHLYGLVVAEKIKETVKTFFDRGYIIKPWYYLKEEENYNYFSVSTKLTYGVSEKNLINRFISGIENLIKINKEALQEYYNNNKDKVVDIIFRSFGLVKFANKMDYNEAISHLSNVRTGLELGIDLKIKTENLNKAFLEIKNGFVAKFAEENNISDNDVARMQILKKIFN